MATGYVVGGTGSFTNITSVTEANVGANGYYKSGNLIVINVSVMTSISAFTDLELWNMPTGLKPPRDIIGTAYSNGAVYQIHVNTNGKVSLYGTAAQSSKTFYGQASYLAE